MPLSILHTGLKEILPLRNLFLQENNFQIRYNACHERGWTNSYLVLYNGEKIGYGSIKGNEHIADRDTAFEFYIIPPYRHLSKPAFSEFLFTSKAVFIECQSNNRVLTHLLYDHAENIHSDVILFEAGPASNIQIANAVFRKRNQADVIFEHKAEPVGDYLIEVNKEVVATGGYLTHYNFPFADIYMEVREDQRRKGFGSLLIQEVKKQCYLNGRVPAARTALNNIASRATLLKGGLQVAGFMLLGRVRPNLSQATL